MSFETGITIGLFVLLPGFVAYAISHNLLGIKIKKTAIEITQWSLLLSVIIFTCIILVVNLLEYYGILISFSFDELIEISPLIYLFLIGFTFIFGVLSAIVMEHDPFGGLREKITGHECRIAPQDTWNLTIGSWPGYAVVETNEDKKFFGYIAQFDDDKEEIYLKRWEDRDSLDNIIDFESIEIINDKENNIILDDFLGLETDGILFPKVDIKRIYFIIEGKDKHTNN